MESLEWAYYEAVREINRYLAEAEGSSCQFFLSFTTGLGYWSVQFLNYTLADSENAYAPSGEPQGLPRDVILEELFQLLDNLACHANQLRRAVKAGAPPARDPSMGCDDGK